MAEIPRAEFIRLRVLRKARDKAKRVYDSLKDRHREQLESLYDLMTEGADADEDVGSTVIGGTMFVPYKKLRAYITDEAAFLAWAREQDETLYENPVKPREGLLNTEVRKRLDDDEPLPPGVSFTETPQISQRKA